MAVWKKNQAGNLETQEGRKRQTDLQQAHSSGYLILAKEKAKPNLPGTLGDKGIFLKTEEKLQSYLTPMRTSFRDSTKT